MRRGQPLPLRSELHFGPQHVDAKLFEPSLTLRAFDVDACLEIGPDRTLVSLVNAAGLLPARAFHALKLRDYARIDYRLTPESKLVFLEANANPDLSPHTFGDNCCFAGVDYPDLISGIVQAALKRAAR